MEKSQLTDKSARACVISVLRCVPKIAALESREHSRRGLPSARPSSPSPSVSLVEIKEETRLVLGAFLRRTVALPLAQRPGRVGGAFRDLNKYSAGPTDECGRAEGDRASLDSQSSSEGEKQNKLRNLIKKHLKHRSSISYLRRDSEKTDSRHSKDVQSPSSSSSEDGGDGEAENKKKKKNKKKRLKSPFSSLIQRIKSSKKDAANKDASEHRRPSSLPVSASATSPVEPLRSPGHPPEFYAEVAETIDKFAKRHSLENQGHKPAASAISNKEALIQELVKTLQMHGDAIDAKIQANPFLRSSLANMSYLSFTNLVEKFASQARPPAVAPASPTLSRIAMTMEVSRRVVTATGTQRIRGYAEHYMEKFVPWVKSHGGWENILHLEEALEYDLQD
ncbi:hypothetical protein GJAV_G00217260 [Gymnothorax javanicus]|nr:hypothetical protein GJAV_G00217260 [Gymnothorax javanicus]